MVTDYSVSMGSVHIPMEDWVAQISEKKLLEEFKTWGEDAQKLIGCLRQPNRWYIHGVYPQLDTYVKGNVALLGDAVRTSSALQWAVVSRIDQAHAMLPNLGAGAGQGI